MEFTLTIIRVASTLGFSVGYLWGEAFSDFDGRIKYKTEWFKNLNPFYQWVVGCLLDVTHHFQYGLALILWVMLNLSSDSIRYLLILYTGWGLVISDWKDYDNVLKRAGFGVRENDST